MKKVAWFSFYIIVLLFSIYKFKSFFTAEKCKKCHNIEIPSLSHKDLSCRDCHRGNSGSENKEIAHKGLYSNPSDPTVWDRTCGKCHFYQLQRVKSSLMLSNIGIIKKIFDTWEYATPNIYATFKGFYHLKNGSVFYIQEIKNVDHISADLYRKFCSRCHLAKGEFKKYRGIHGSGCAGCHFPYNNTGTYKGKDKLLFNKFPYSAYHKIILPSSNRCLACHNRSARIGLSYIGLCELNNSMVPTTNGYPGPYMISGGRSAVFVREDIHFKAKMECIDCHTSRDIMGDGYVYITKKEQVEIKCSNCHGTGYSYPETEKVLRENHPSVVESKKYPVHIKIGMDVVLTSKKRPFSNVFFKNGKVYVIGKISGKIYKSPLITNTKEHTIYGHKRLSCSCCHSLYAQQCFGCHVIYNINKLAKDYIKNRFTPGKFKEKEDYRCLFPFPLGINQQNKITPVVPGCQTFLTIIRKGGKTLKKEYITKYKGRHSLRFAPIVPHTTKKKPIKCKICHTNPYFLGFGTTITYKNSFIPLFICEKNKNLPLDGFIVLTKGKVIPVASIIGKKSRNFNTKEIKKIFSVAKCLICHNDPKDPIYQKKLDYSRLDKCLSYPYINPYKKRRMQPQQKKSLY